MRHLFLFLAALALVVGIRGVTGTIDDNIPGWQTLVGVFSLSVFWVLSLWIYDND